MIVQMLLRNVLLVMRRLAGIYGNSAGQRRCLVRTKNVQLSAMTSPEVPAESAAIVSDVSRWIWPKSTGLIFAREVPTNRRERLSSVFNSLGLGKEEYWDRFPIKLLVVVHGLGRGLYN